MGIKAVIFDFGGVIAFFQDEKDLAGMAAAAGVDAAPFKKWYWETRCLYDQGTLSPPEYFDAVIRGAKGGPAGTERENPENISAALLDRLVKMDVKSWARINPETERLIRDLKNNGYKTGILSNMIQPFVDWAYVNLPLWTFVDVGLFSCEAREIKPHAAIYRILLEKCECAADEVVFFDDMESNVAGAKALGIRAFLWQGADSARHTLTTLVNL
ncbi:MAG: HAD family phosphatase [Treponema sp.]|jgi:putative hydrolase of the HAD superfamily|nr:HAD family phosphatase [Treponema sp.]